ncbi:immunoglobulin-like domain-containing protein [Salisediminibacterium selenitireducens]|uniref:Peptidase S8 and S53 subtilisin kexin sedolisin n=1 Tax=Bacillus selenitireducens (strain ATCC 700615 / DSM 15326 / MLS10) TaxID=439292 RepID=D6XZK2_BACIE|nr:immunoglobulin-like domain-containing protein [Salisediminibacterium selenitireducens]ADH98376.1 peptidase S8 and S53 subtilisin kexin sedolisin [[Bacillus] selenitireducens MLS10]
MGQGKSPSAGKGKPWRKRLSILLIASLFFSLATPAGYAQEQEEHLQVIIQYQDDIPEEPTRFGWLNVPVYDNVKDMENLNVRTASVPVSEMASLLADPGVLSVEEAVPFEFHETYPERFSGIGGGPNDDAPMWHNQMIGAYDAWEDGFTGEDVKVAVFDSGFFDHDDIDYAGGVSVIDEETDFTKDPNGHGTSVAGVIGSLPGTEAEGMASGVDLYGVKVSHQDEDGNNRVGDTSHIVQGIEWAIEEEMDIINLSLGWDDYLQNMHRVFQSAADEGILIVASSGNHGNDEGTGENMVYPAKFDEVIAVASLDPDKERAYYSSTGPENELAAPGGKGRGFQSEQIYTINNENAYSYMSGTSFASPHIAGLGALLMQRNPDWSATEIRQYMIDHAEDLGEPGRNELYGFGLASYQPAGDEPEVPELIYDGPLEIDVSEGASFEIPEVSVSHSEDLDVRVSLFDSDGNALDPDTFSTDIPGTYTWRFDAEDEAGNQAEPLFITVNVLETVDEEPPVIIYDGPLTFTVSYGAEFFLPDVTVEDNVDEDLTAEVMIQNEAGAVLDVLDTTEPGTYTLTYTAEDSAGNEAEPLVITVTVEEKEDTTPPELVYEGPTAITVAYGEGFTMPEVRVTDDTDEDLLPTVTIENEAGETLSAIDTTEPGTYTLTYTAEDSAGNEAEPLVITVTVEEKEDTTPPELVYEGPTEITVAYGEGFTIPEVSVTDDTDEDLLPTVTIENEAGETLSAIDTTEPGTYTLTYTAEDSAGNEAEPLVITVTVEEKEDTTPPELVYEGPTEITVAYGEGFTIPEVSVTDDTDEDLLPTVTIENEAGETLSAIDTTEPGTYTLTYTAEDSAGNEAEPLVITVTVEEKEDTTPPELVYEGPTEITVAYGEGFTIPEVSVTDDTDEDLLPTVTIENEAGETLSAIDTTEPGTYTLTYTAEDSAGNEAEPLVITVTVEEKEDTTPPELVYEGPTEITVAYGEGFTIPEVSVTDNTDEDLLPTVTIENEAGETLSAIDTTEPGTYTLTYTAEDSAGNEAEPLVITVTVEEKEAPSFSDVDERERFHLEIRYLAGLGIIGGYTDGRFGPDDVVTRGQAAIMIGRALGFDGEQRETSFPDVGMNTTFSGFVQEAADRGIIQGFPDGSYRPDAPVTRGQMAIFIARAFDLETEADADFSDVSPSMQSYSAVRLILHENITEGFPDGTFRPDNDVTRGQFSAFLSRTLNEDFRGMD